MNLQCGRFELELTRPQIMGIVNVTPDSFSDGGDYSNSVEQILAYAHQLIADGADILDIGAESTRPGSSLVNEEEEWSRLEPVLRELYDCGVPLSVDTRKTRVMQKLLQANLVDMINDIEALQDEGAMQLLAQYPSIAICLMHMQGKPNTMQIKPLYHDVCAEVATFFKQQISVCQQYQIDLNRIVLDLGIGFGKTLSHNIDLIKNIPQFSRQFSLPILIGVSRKKMLQEITGETNPKQRLGASITAAIESVRLGAKIIRVHDVKPTKQALEVFLALNN